MFRRKLVVFGRSVPLAVIVAAVTVFAVAAWAASLVLTGTQTLSFNVSEAPEIPNLSVSAEECTITAGSGSPVLALNGLDIGCEVNEFSDDTVGLIYYEITNNDAVRSVTYSRIIPADDACVTFTASNLTGTIAPGGNAGFRTSFAGVSGLGGTITCAGTSIGQFVAEIDFEITP